MAQVFQQAEDAYKGQDHNRAAELLSTVIEVSSFVFLPVPNKSESISDDALLMSHDVRKQRLTLHLLREMYTSSSQR